jgi:DNA replication and repair protein RecF
MHLERLELRDFRSYARVDVPLGPGVRVLVGANAQGKTNLLEAVHYLATGASHRVTADAALVRAGAEAAVVRAVARSDGGRAVTIELELRPGGRNRARLNGQPQPRARDALGQLRAVLFAPEDLQIVRGDPSDRRRFLDDLLAQRRPAYLAARQEYERALRQRTAVLRGVRAGGGSSATLETWTDAVIATGAPLLAARIAAVHALAGPVAQAYADLVADGPKADAAPRLTYRVSTGREIVGNPDEGVPDPAALAGELAEGLRVVAVEERERGLTLAGPHRDELVLDIGSLPAKGYASHGEQWSLTLALRLASRAVLAEVGDEPIVLLDDVFAELDDTRRRRLAGRCAAFPQVLVSAAVADDVPLAGVRYRVGGGTITMEQPA